MKEMTERMTTNFVISSPEVINLFSVKVPSGILNTQSSIQVHKMQLLCFYWVVIKDLVLNMAGVMVSRFLADA